MTQQSVVIDPTVQLGAGEDPAHVQQMVEKADGLNQPQPTTNTERPSWLPEKFATPEDMAKAYAELEKKQGQGKPEAPASEAAPAPTPQEAAQAVSDKGLDLGTYEAEFAEKGSLSEESYAKLAQAGFQKELVDRYIAGQMAAGEALKTEVFGIVGGEQNYSAMVDWARANMSEAQIEAFNKSLDGNTEQVKLAVQGLYAAYAKANGSEPSLVKADTNAPASGGFESTAQIVEAMKDPRYKSDPAYRAMVERRVAVSTVL